MFPSSCAFCRLEAIFRPCVRVPKEVKRKCAGRACQSVLQTLNPKHHHTNPKPPTEFYTPHPRFGSPEAAPSDIGCCLHVASNEDLLALAEQHLTANTQRVLGSNPLAVARPGNPRFGETQDPKPQPSNPETQNLDPEPCTQIIRPCTLDADRIRCIYWRHHSVRRPCQIIGSPM